MTDHHNVEAVLDLRRASNRATTWTIVGHGAGLALRLGSSMILTRLLLPEFFGMMVIVNIYLAALELLTDIGVGPSIIQHARGEDDDFLNTAWTMQVGRGVLLWLCGWGSAGMMARAYGQPQLAVLLPVATLSALIEGFASTARFTLNRRIHLGRLTCLELGSQAIGIIFMITWALVDPSIWALVYGGVLGALIRTIATHFLIPGFRNRWCWDAAAAHSLFHFGKWILLSTMLSFLVHRGDKLLLGAVLSMAELGVFGIAANLAQLPAQLAGTMSGKVLFPLFARLSDSSQTVLRREIARIRLRMTLVSILIHSVLALAAGPIVRAFWPEAFWDAGRMAQILAIGGIGRVAVESLQPVFLACGDARSHLLSTSSSAAVLILSLVLGHHFGGVTGILIGLSVAPTLHYPVVAFLAARHKAWTPLADLPALGASVALAVIVAIWW